MARVLFWICHLGLSVSSAALRVIKDITLLSLDLPDSYFARHLHAIWSPICPFGGDCKWKLVGIAWQSAYSFYRVHSWY